jgi:hypothetical protein
MSAGVRPPFARPVCACPADVALCRTWPGQLIPSDVEQLGAACTATGRLDAPERIFTLLAPSRGAVVLAGGGPARVPTLVPRMEAGRCVFLDAADRCTVHAVAPFGCAFFDVHLAAAEGHRRADWGLRAILASDAYPLAWLTLARGTGAPVEPPVMRDHPLADAPILPAWWPARTTPAPPP